MSPTSQPYDPLRPAPEEVNAGIRRLMSEPAGARRAVEYERFLELWAEATRPDVVPAA